MSNSITFLKNCWTSRFPIDRGKPSTDILCRLVLVQGSTLLRFKTSNRMPFITWSSLSRNLSTVDSLEKWTHATVKEPPTLALSKKTSTDSTSPKFWKYSLKLYTDTLSSKERTKRFVERCKTCSASENAITLESISCSAILCVGSSRDLFTSEIDDSAT